MIEVDQEVVRLTNVIQDMAHELLQVEQHCPCGARPETPKTHPHAPGCSVARALDIWEDAFVRSSQSLTAAPEGSAHGQRPTGDVDSRP